MLTEACGHYAQTNHVLHVVGIVWPPEKTSPNFRACCEWLKGAVGIDDDSLNYDVIEFPPSHDIHLSDNEGLWPLQTPDPPAGAISISAVVTRPPASPAP